MKTLVTFGNLYLGNKMTRVPFLNTPWFDETAAKLRAVPGVSQVFNPAEWMRLKGFDPMLCPSGTPEECLEAGFDVRPTVSYYWKWIAEYSNGLVIGPDWATSKGTIAEIACHQDLGLPVWEESRFFQGISFGAAADLFDYDWQFPPLGNYLI
jgi:hypothetical protein